MFPGESWRDPFLLLAAFHTSGSVNFLIWKQRKAMLQVAVDDMQVGAALTHSKLPPVKCPGCQ